MIRNDRSLPTTSLKIAFYSYFFVPIECTNTRFRFLDCKFPGSSGAVANRLSLSRPIDDCIREANGNFAKICIRKGLREFGQCWNILIGCYLRVPIEWIAHCPFVWKLLISQAAKRVGIIAWSSAEQVDKNCQIENKVFVEWNLGASVTYKFES